jgi:hypothetical protein
VQHFQFCFESEKLGREVGLVTDSERAIEKLSGPGAREGRQFLHGAHRQVWIDDECHLIHDRLRDRREIAHGVVGQ